MRTFITSVTLLVALFSMPIQACPLDDARNAGQVEEMPNGYVMATAHGKASSDVSDLVTDVNERRRDAYENIAKKNGISVDQVASESYKKRHGK
jgi:uncharacterized protein YdbL (DUF1318 family)